MGVLDTDPHSLVAVMGAFFRHFYLVSIISGWGAQAEGTLLGGLTCCFGELLGLHGDNTPVGCQLCGLNSQNLLYTSEATL